MFHLIAHLILLPLVLIRMVFALLGMVSHLLLIPIKIFARHTVACVLIAGVLILYLAIKKDPHALDSMKPNPAEKQAKNLPKGAVPLIEPVSKIEDGDSVFATDVYKIMSQDERVQYSSNFYKIIGGTKDGEATSWSFYNIQGSIRPIRTFYNNNGQVCRSFTEVLKVHRIQQTLSGTACDNGGGTWCKLKPNATPACGLGGSGGGTFDSLGRAVKNLF